MKLTILGRYGKFPCVDGSTCGYLLQSEKANILIEAGSGTLRNLVKILPYQDIDAIVLSHHHGDHTADAYVFRNIAFEYVKTMVWEARIPVFMPHTPAADFSALSSCIGFDAKVISDRMKVSVKDIDLEFFAAKHPLETYGMVFSDGKSTFGYTADTVNCENLKPLIDSSETILADAAILEKDHNENSPHISVKEIATLCKGKKVILTHLPCGKENEVLLEALSVNGNAILAKELETYIV